MNNDSPIVPDWYIAFQMALLQEAPRPGSGEGDINEVSAKRWTDNRGSLRKVLSICPSPSFFMESGEPSKSELLLKYLGTVRIRDTKRTFVARRNFKSDDSHKTVNIHSMDKNFSLWFLNNKGKVEQPAGEQTIRYSELQKQSTHFAIVNELGGITKAQSTLAELFSLLKKQARDRARGKEGVLSNDGAANIFYIADTMGVPRAVCMNWVKERWHLYASSIFDKRTTYPDESRVFSRNQHHALELPESSSETALLGEKT